MNRPSGQSLNDRLIAARYTIAGQGLARVVCKATTEELMAPKKKHLDYLLHCTNEPNVSIPQLANLLIERTQNGSWIVVFKSLVTVHHLMCYGNERFTQYLASSNCTFNLCSFNDKLGTPQGPEMATFIRRHSKYLNEKALSYRMVAFDFCKVKRGKEQGEMRTMTIDKLLKTIPTLQNQLDALLEFDATPSDLCNGVITASFMLLFKDLIRLFACYNDGIINILEKYFELGKKQCREALECYKKFLIRMDRVGEFLKVAENIGIDKGDIPDLTRAPNSLLDALEQHLATLEGRKYVPSNPQPPRAADTNGFSNAVSILSNTSSTFGNAASQQDESLRQAILEEEKALNRLKQKHMQTGVGDPTNPFLTSDSGRKNPDDILNLFDAPLSSVPQTADFNNANKASDDLLNLNPFADPSLFSVPGNPVLSNPSDLFGSPALNSNPVQQTQSVQPTHCAVVVSRYTGSGCVATDSIIKGDLDATLANLASNLDISPAHRSKQQATLSQMSTAKQTTAGASAGWTPNFGSGGAIPQNNPGDMIFSDLFSTNTAAPAPPTASKDPFGDL